MEDLKKIEEDQAKIVIERINDDAELWKKMLEMVDKKLDERNAQLKNQDGKIFKLTKELKQL